MNQTIYITANKRKYPLVISSCTDIEDTKKWFIHIKCEVAKLDQEYLTEDLTLL